MKWSYFAGAVALAWFLLFSYGAPFAAVATGTGMAACWNFYKRKH